MLNLPPSFPRGCLSAVMGARTWERKGTNSTGIFKGFTPELASGKGEGLILHEYIKDLHESQHLGKERDKFNRNT